MAKSTKKNEKKKEIPEKVETEFITKKELDEKFDAFFERMKGIQSFTKSNNTNADDEHIRSGANISNTELGKDHGGIEPVNEMDISKGVIELEAFMNEKLLINVSQTTEKGSLPVLVPSVNGVNQPIIRGRDVLVKRKFVEVLARTRNTNYTQIVDQLNPEKFQMAPDTAIKDPFVVLNDPHPHGRKWLEKILREAA